MAPYDRSLERYTGQVIASSRLRVDRLRKKLDPTRSSRVPCNKGRELSALLLTALWLVSVVGALLSLKLPRLWSLEHSTAAPTSAPPQRTSGTAYQPSFRDLVGANGFIDIDNIRNCKIGWFRLAFYWDTVEPSRGQWSWASTDKQVQMAHSENVEVLPMLAYTAQWDSTGPKGFYPPKNPADWTDYVTATVSRYTAAPYNLRYFQVWNEPVNAAGFWEGATDRQWVDEIYIPAARIIRAHGANVVFGGWPSGSTMEAYSAELEYHNAWQWTDILDIHYYPVAAFQALYSRWIATGRCKGIWETEVGSRNNPALLTNLYSSVFNWARTRGNWTFAEQYKLFWYPGGGAGCDACLIKPTPDHKGYLPTENAKALRALAQSLP